MSAREIQTASGAEESQATRARFETSELCSGSGTAEKGSIEKTIGRPVRLSASRKAPKRTWQSHNTTSRDL
jgi:hypothetical protein